MNRKHLDAYRRAGLGLAPESESEDMRITSAGDVHYYNPPAPAAPSPQKSSILPMLAVAGLTAAGLAPVAGVAGYFVNQALSQKPQATILSPPAQQTTTINQEDLTVRLLRPEDLRP